MADQIAMRLASRRTTPKPLPRSAQSQKNASQSPPRRSTRVTRSQSREISNNEVVATGAKGERRRPQRAVANHKEDAIDRSTHNAQRGKRVGQKRVLQDLPTVTEDSSIPHADLLLEGAEQQQVNSDVKASRRQRAQGAKTSGDLSGFSGTTARTSYSAQDLAHSNPQSTLRKEAVNNATTALNDNETANKESLRVELHYESPSELSHTTSEQTDTARNSALRKTIPPASELSFNTPKVLRGMVSHLKHRKAKQEVKKAPEQIIAQQKAETSPKFAVTEVPNPPDRDLRYARIDGNLVRPSSGAARSLHVSDNRVETDDTWQPDLEDEEGLYSASIGDSELNAVARGRQVLEFQAKREAESNKENLIRDLERRPRTSPQNLPGRSAPRVEKKHFIDRQLGAERVTFESQETVQSNRNSQSQRSGNEIIAAEIDNRGEIEDVSSDEGYQEDRRRINATLRRKQSHNKKRLAPRSAHDGRPSPKRLCPNPRDDSVVDDISGAVLRHNQEQSPTPTQLENYKMANAQAKLNTATQPKKVQVRKAWTDEEMEALIDLIEEYGTSWTLLKERDAINGSILESRDQIALKDKARNMKVDFLKAGAHMPHNFENVPLNRQQIEKIRSLGIDYNPSTGRRDE